MRVRTLPQPVGRVPSQETAPELEAQTAALRDERLRPLAFLVSDLFCSAWFYGVQQQGSEAAVVSGAVPVVAGADELFTPCKKLHAIECLAVLAAYGGHQHGLAAGVALAKGVDLIQLAPMLGDRRDK